MVFTRVLSWRAAVMTSSLAVCSWRWTRRKRVSKTQRSRHSGSTCLEVSHTSANLPSYSQSDTKAKVDAVTRARGEPVTQLLADWESMMTKFRAKFGLDIPEFHLPGQSYFEAFEEKLNEGRLKPETLAHVISVEEEEEMERKKPEGPKHLSLTLDAQLTVATRRRCLSSMPRNTEELRAKCRVMSNMWLLARAPPVQ